MVCLPLLKLSCTFVLFHLSDITQSIITTLCSPGVLVIVYEDSFPSEAVGCKVLPHLSVGIICGAGEYCSLVIILNSNSKCYRQVI